MILTVDGRRVELADGATVLDAVNRLGIALPQLCKDPDRAALGACRTCLVHVDGQRGTPAACHLPARDGMVVDTQHPEVVRVRATVLDLTRSMLTPAPHRNGFGQLGEAVARHGRLEPSWAPLHAYDEDASKSFFVLDRDACILCGRCAVACDEVQQIGAIALLGRGHATKVGVFGDGSMASSVCTSCGQCVATCPTGALRPKEPSGKIASTVSTTCPYCGVGCGIVLRVREGESEGESEGGLPLGQKGGRLALMTDDAPTNRSSLGMLCVKGRFATGFVHAHDRITRPMIKRDGRWHEATWDEALDAAADGLGAHRGRFGALASAKATNEDGYLVQKFCRVVMATNDVDHCTRLCHSPSVEAMLASMGSGATSNSYQDYEEAGCLMVVGADASANHPVIAVRFRRAVSRGARLIVVNPKRVELCDQADLWLAQRPGTNLLQGLYSPKSNWIELARPWRNAAALLAALGLLALVLEGAEYWTLRRADEHLGDLLTQSCQKILGTNRASACDAELQRRRSNAGGANAETFLTTLEAVASARDPELRIDSLVWRNRTMDLQLVAADVGALDKFAKSLEQTHRFKPKIESANQNDTGVEGRVRIAQP